MMKPTTEPFPADVSAAVVAYNAIGTIGFCLRGLMDSGCPPQRLTVYDVASTDGTGEWITQHHPGVRLVRLEKNRGPNPARNLAVTQSKTPLVLLLDSDVQLLPGTVATLRRTMGDDPRVGIATPVVLFADRPETVQYRRTGVHYLAEASADVHDIPLAELAGATAEVGLASGCAPLIRVRAALAVGLFEERYFFGKTDGEFAYRMTVGGYKILETAATQVLHHHTKRGSTYFMHQVCNRWHFILKDFQLRTLVAILPVLLVHEPALFLLLLVKGKAGDYFRAVAALLRMLPGLREDRRAVQEMRRCHDWEVLRGDKLVIPADVSRGPLALLACAYRTLLSLYWNLARSVLRIISHPIKPA